ncbi:alginate lyase family protein [Halomarina litorea]|uniref:alginate lyase family protein n=1 Tax=Halomarina litorea TaxID=2961595 RepID=UPI0020C4327A|nr:alginate lyase family protein [Halomarina sp. BCD28]
MKRLDEDVTQPGVLDRWRIAAITVSNMQREQLLGMLERNARQAILPRLPIDFDARYEARIPDELSIDSSALDQNTGNLRSSLSRATRTDFRERLQAFENRKLEFLNHEVALDSNRAIEFDDDQLADVPLLWWLKYQSLEPVKWLVLGLEDPESRPDLVNTVDEWVKSLLDTTTIGSKGYLRRDWIPHAVSLRVIHLARYCAWLREHDVTVDRSILRYLYKNALFLENHVEYDVGGNHLIENATALFVAGTLFKESPRWRTEGKQLLEELASDQFLSDGGHFERSPMYHVMVLTRYLTAANLLQLDGNSAWSPILSIARDATQFARSLTPPDEAIPLLNDSVFGEELSLAEVSDYAAAVGPPVSDLQSRLDSSGYYWLGSGANRMLVDAGPVGPAHLPGHSHNALLSILLWLDGNRVFTDTGVSQYSGDSGRQYVRSVQAHNTVQVDDSEPNDIAGQYLMGRRANPTVTYSTDGTLERLVGTYSKVGRGDSKYRHTRNVCSSGDWWLVLDSVDMGGRRPVQSRLHAHPDIELDPTTTPGEYQILESEGSTIGSFYALNCDAVERAISPYFPAFGVEREREALELTYDSSRATSGFLVSRWPYDTVEYDSKTDTLKIEDELFAPFGDDER